ncbi:MAG: DUF1772 domain-containing protein [Thermoanaerobaculia bacterium]
MGRKLLWFLVVMLGVEIGAGLYEARVLVPLWSRSAPESLVAYNTQSLRPNPGFTFWMISTPLTGLVSLINLVFAWRAKGPTRRFWLGGAMATLIVFAVTFLYFVPELRAFQALRDAGAADMAGRVQRWVTLNWVRAVVYVAAWLSLLHAYANGAGVVIAAVAAPANRPTGS